MVPGRRVWSARGPRGCRSARTRFPAGAIEAWRTRGPTAAARLPDAAGDRAASPQAKVQHQLVYDGLHVEHLTWQLPYGPPTEAVFLKPAGAKGRLPAVLGLHDHGGNKYFGWPKIAQMSDQLHPMMKEHRDALLRRRELGQRAGQTRVRRPGPRHLRLRAAVASASAMCSPVLRKDLKEVNPESDAEIKAYNTFAAEHETSDGQEPLLRRDDLAGRLHGRGPARARLPLRARRRRSRPASAAPASPAAACAPVTSPGLDDRIRCACCVGMMTTWRDYLLNKCYTHTWMIYIPGLPRDLDYPEILGLRVPLPTLVLNDTGGPALHAPRDATGRPDPVGGLRQGRRRRPVHVLVLSRARTSSTAPCRPRRSPGSSGG